MSSLLITNIKELLTLRGVSKKQGVRPQEKDLGIIKNAALLIHGKKIVWIGKNGRGIPKADQVINAKGAVVFPGFVDPHTHLIFAGSRHSEFAWRCAGETYLNIVKKEGGIFNSVKATHLSSEKELFSLGMKRLKKASSFGITTLEVKSGYGLLPADEYKCLNVISRLQQASPLRIVRTFLGAHAFPPEFKKRPQGFVDLLCEKMIPEVSQRKLAEFCDVFIDEGFFTLTQTRYILTAAKKYNLKIRIHADEFKSLGGTELAVSLGALSVDHLMAVNPKGIKALAASHTVATLLPGTSFFLGKPYAPARKLVDAGVVVALGTDFNPGTCPTQNLPLMATIAATQMKMTLPEVIAAITYNAAKSLGLHHEIGSIEIGKSADLAFFNIPSYAYLPYHFGDNDCTSVIIKGIAAFDDR